MQSTGYRSGRVGVLATLVLLLSIVLFIGCLFWLSLNGPWSGGSLFGNELFKPATMTTETEQHEEEVSLNETAEVLNISEALDDLKDGGCFFTEYKEEYSGTNTIRLEYKEFKEKAVDRKLVFTYETPESMILLVSENSSLYEWTP